MKQTEKIREELIVYFFIFCLGVFVILTVWVFNKWYKKKQIKKAEYIDFEKELSLSKIEQNSNNANETSNFRCSNCGSTNPIEARFCNKCGSPNFDVFRTNENKIIDLDAFERFATFKERFLAKLIDLFILLIIMSIIFLTIYGDSPYNLINYWFVLLWSTCLIVLYDSIWLSSSFQATPGRFWMHLQVVRTNSKSISFFYAVLRDIAEWISGATFSLGYFMMILNKENMTLHDYIVSSVVVKKKIIANKEQKYFHYRNIAFLGMGGICLGFLTLLKTGGRNLESEKLGSYFAGIMFAYGFLLIALIISLLNRIITRKWLKNIYTTTWYI
jgi:uncharacterized RDD family membrane protein YckC